MIKAIFPGTFDPIHYGHIDIALRASKLFDELIIAVYDRPLKNLLFSPSSRIDLVKQCFKDENNIHVVGYNNLTVDFCKEQGAKVIVRGLRVFSDFEYEFRMALANKRLAKDIEVVALITSEQHTFLSSTTVKEIAALAGDISTMVPPHVNDKLAEKMLLIGETKRLDHHTSLRD
ncbi:MAG: pantetheine-phosphate adenylyltransferase [Pelolinea sp.]|nr:pantetheine-phosphate adenylyltransferase [Pelolinea sp.]